MSLTDAVVRDALLQRSGGSGDEAGECRSDSEEGLDGNHF